MSKTAKYGIFPNMVYTERPDKFVSNIVEGKIGVILDGFPIGYILPCTFPMLMQDAEEYTTNYIIGTFVRVLRYVALLVTILAPAFYIAITVFHNEMIPRKLTVSIARSKMDVPFPVFVEVVVLLLAFEMLIEAGTRLPKNIGQTISILGGLIVGEAAINAKFVSPAVVVVVAATGITSFLIPNQDLTNALRISRFLLVAMAGVAGLFGISCGVIIIMYYLSSLESFGVPYLKPFVANQRKNAWYETIIRPSLSKKQKVRW